MFLVWNGDSDGQDIFTMADDLVNTNSTSYPLASKARAANKWLRTIWSWIFFAYGGQQYDDGNQTDLPSASDTLTVDKRIYANAAGAIALTGVGIKDASGNYNPLLPITLDQIVAAGYTIDTFYSSSGTPKYYMPIGNSTYIFPASDTTRSSGFKQYFNRGSVSIASTATSTNPGFASEFHDVMASGIALEFAKRKGKPQAGGVLTRGMRTTGLLAEMQDYEGRIKKFYSQRYQQMFPPRITSRDLSMEMY